jgi:hypothetical protein
MKKPTPDDRPPVCLTIAGLDPSGGAGVIADVKTFSAFGCFATAAVTCVLGFVFVAVVLGLSWLALHQWHDSYERTDV